MPVDMSRAVDEGGDVARRPSSPPDVRQNGAPTPHERADFVARRLEQFIRDNRTVERGVNFRRWQDMARIELANAIEDAELNSRRDDVATKRFLFVAASSLITIGFWGVAFSWGRVGYLAAATICLFAAFGLFAVALEWPLRRTMKRMARRKRGAALGRTEDLNGRIRQMERELRHEAQELEKAVERARKAKGEVPES